MSFLHRKRPASGRVPFQHCWDPDYRDDDPSFNYLRDLIDEKLALWLGGIVELAHTVHISGATDVVIEVNKDGVAISADQGSALIAALATYYDRPLNGLTCQRQPVGSRCRLTIRRERALHHR